MKKRKKSNILRVTSSIGVVTLMLGCASAAPKEGASVSRTSVSRASLDSDLMGTWRFVLASSDVAPRIREHCSNQSGGDSKKADACWDEASADAANEKIRFTKNETGQVVWTSFSVEGEKENVYVAAPVALTADGAKSVWANIVGTVSGERASEFEQAKIERLHLERIDARTLVMIDPRKGRLVFSRE